MRFIRAWLRRLLGTAGLDHSDADFAREIEGHLQLDVDDGIRSGLSPEEARRRAMIRLGGAGTTELWRERRGLPLIETGMKDMSYAVRTLSRTKGWTLVAILSLGLGAGANTALFSMADRALWQPLHVPSPDNLIALSWSGTNPAAVRTGAYGYAADVGRQSGAGSFPFPLFERLRDAAGPTAQLFAFVPTNIEVTTSAAPPVAARGQFVSGDYFSVLGLRAAAGRLITEADSAVAAPVAVLSSEFARKRAGTEAVGTTIKVNGRAFQVIGVAEEDSPNLLQTGSRPFDVSIPLTAEPAVMGTASRLQSSTDWWLVVMGRMRPLSAPSEVIARLDAELVNAVGKTAKDGAAPVRLLVRKGTKGRYDSQPQTVTGIVVAAGVFVLIWLIVSLNLATMSFLRFEQRRQEIAVRAALGASRTRLVRQLLTESSLLSLLAAGAGIALAFVVLRIANNLEPGFPLFDLNSTVLTFAVGVAVASTAVFGVLPALSTTKPGRLWAAHARHVTVSRWASVLVICQVALSLVLLVPAGLLTRTVSNLRRADVGFSADSLYFFRLESSQPRAEIDSPEVQENLIARLLAVPGVAGVTTASEALLAGRNSTTRLTLEGGESTEAISAIIVRPGFFETLGIPLRRGRAFQNDDFAGGEPVAVINESMGRQVFPGADPIGKTFNSRWHAPTPIRIVGVVADTRAVSLRDEGRPIWYSAQRRNGKPAGTFYVRVSEPALDVTSSIRQGIRDVVPDYDGVVSRQSVAVAEGYAAETTLAVSAGALGVVALLISVVGLAGLISYAVVLRTKEIGLRMALGASRLTVVWSVLRQALTLAMIGGLLGVGFAQLASQLLRRLLFGIAPSDPITIGVVVLGALLVAAIATSFPARRAASVNPIDALRPD